MAAENHTPFDLAALAGDAVAPPRLPLRPSPVTPSRRACLLGAGIAAVAGGGAAAAASPSPEIAGAIADYRARMAEANARGASDELVDRKSDEMEAAAARLAAARCRGPADVAAMVVFFVDVMTYQNVWPSLTAAEGDVLVSARNGALALAGGAW